MKNQKGQGHKIKTKEEKLQLIAYNRLLVEEANVSDTFHVTYFHLT